jgi:nucleoside-diphosphate-sugar epimerase
MDINRKAPPFFTYTAQDWNPLSYQEASDPATNAVIAYRGSKKFAEMEAWDFVREVKPSFNIVTICPPITFGPVVHSVTKANDLNESNAMLWQVASGGGLPIARVPFWVDVRDLAEAHVEALLRPEIGNKRFVVAAPEHYSYGLAAKIVAEKFESLKDGILREEQTVDGSHNLDGETAAQALRIKYRTFQETVVDLVSQAMKME